MTFKNFFMIKTAFGNIQCLLCYKTFKEYKEQVIKKHYDSFHSNMNKFNDNEREEEYNKNKNIFFKKLKGWLLGEENKETIFNEFIKKIHKIYDFF